MFYELIKLRVCLHSRVTVGIRVQCCVDMLLHVVVCMYACIIHMHWHKILKYLHSTL